MELNARVQLREGDAREVSVLQHNKYLFLTNSIFRRIQEQGLRTYLFTYAPHYNTLSLSLLSRTFSLPLRNVTSIVSKMIWNEELSASLDQSVGVVVFHRIELSRTQQLAQTVAEKVGAMVESNEKSLDVKLGGSGGWGDRAEGSKGEKRGEQAQGERRGRGERTRGTRGKSHTLRPIETVLMIHVRRHTWRKRLSICAWLGQSDAWSGIPESLVLSCHLLHSCHFLTHVLDYTIRSIKTIISVLNKLAVVVTSIAGGTRSFVVVILVSFLRSSGPVNI